MVNIGVIGIGVIAKYYLAAFPNIKSAKLQAVCDLNIDKMKYYENQGIDIYTDYKELVLSDNIDAVIINLPNNLHFQACSYALNNGKHVCCEKPLTLSLKEAELLKDLAESKALTLFTAFHRRYNKPLIELKESIDDISNIKHMDITYKEKIEEHAGNDTWYLNPEVCGGGCVADNGPNVFDTISWILGDMKIVDSDIQRDNSGLDLQAQIQLVNNSGQTATAYLDWDYRHGEHKTVTLYLSDDSVISANMLDGFSEFKSSLYHEYAAIIEDLTIHIKEGRGRGEEGIDAVRLVNDAYAMESAIEVCNTGS